MLVYHVTGLTLLYLKAELVYSLKLTDEGRYLAQYSDPIVSLKGVGGTTAARLERLGVHTLGDLLQLTPRKYLDFSQIMPLDRIYAGEHTIRVRLGQIRVRSSRKGTAVIEAIASDDTGELAIVWFSKPYLQQQLAKSEWWLLRGEVAFKYGKFAMFSPMLEPATEEAQSVIRPIYPQTEGLTSTILAKLARGALNSLDKIPERLPESIRKQLDLGTRSQALKQLHEPTSPDEVQDGLRHLKAEVLFRSIGSSLLYKHERLAQTARAIPTNEDFLKQITASLPFKLTDGQRKAIWKVITDTAADRPMSRLLQGDVGSGKTMVAAIATAHAAHQGHQAVIMAPSTLLAKQHAERLKELAQRNTIRLELLIGAASKDYRQQLLNDLAKGEPMVVVGTHALLQPDVKIPKLALAVIDEQHRFGVGQRQALQDKVSHTPHLLSLSATPIPRSLALSMYGDLSLSSLRERPHDRPPAQTMVYRAQQRGQIELAVAEIAASGRQVFWICRSIGAQKGDPAQNPGISAEELHKLLHKGPLRQHGIGLVHGRMNDEQQQQAMEDFASGKHKVLVSTTVVEVGIDIPRATGMVIEDADRFGLASLHQLRGRIGRDGSASQCYLLSSRKSEHKRLRLMRDHDDGFVLAEEDLRLRGPGELFGRMQHGFAPELSFGAEDTVAIEQMHTAIEEFVSTHGLPALRQALRTYESGLEVID